METKSEAFVAAARSAIRLDMIIAKKRAFAEYGDNEGCVDCELTGIRIGYDECHLDHAWPTFGQIVASFRAARDWSEDYPGGIVLPPADKQIVTMFADEEVSYAFRRHHHALAITRLISSNANLSRASLARRPTINRPVDLKGLDRVG